MAKILDAVKMSEPVHSPKNPEPQGKIPPIEDVRNAVIAFLKNTLEVKQVNVTKLVVLDSEKGSWEAEAEVYVPNPTIKALGLPTQKEVLDCQPYLLRVDSQLNIIAYGLKESVG